MNHSEIDAVIKLPASKRYEYFIKKVSDFEEVWGLYRDGWVQTGDGKHTYIPFWPKKEFAELCATKEWDDCTPKRIQLEDFMAKWLPGMQKDLISPCVFLLPENDGMIVSCNRLLSDLSEELDKY